MKIHTNSDKVINNCSGDKSIKKGFEKQTL